MAIMNSDQRMQQVYFNLAKDHEMILINRFTNFDRFDGADALILPIKGLTSTGSLYASGKELVLPKSFWRTMKEQPIFVGIPQPFLDAFPTVYCYMQEEAIKKQNAIYTAEGILYLLIDHTTKALQDLVVDVIGYGACGKAITTWLQALQVKVRIIRRACNEDEPFYTCASYARMQCGDVIINTSISPLFDYDWMQRWQQKPLIIDIASGDVMDYDGALKLGIQVIKAGNLPNMVASESAGNLIAEYIRGKLDGRK